MLPLFWLFSLRAFRSRLFLLRAPSRGLPPLPLCSFFCSPTLTVCSSPPSSAGLAAGLATGFSVTGTSALCATSPAHDVGLGLATGLATGAFAMGAEGVGGCTTGAGSLGC